MKTIVGVAAHKPYRMPEDPVYLPIQAGAKGKPSIGYQRDDEGIGISERNPYYSELTALYWLWKNTRSDAIGLVHYRRYFRQKKAKDPFDAILSGERISRMLEKTGIILPEKRNYYIASVYDHYASTHYAKDLDHTRNILCEEFPEYVEAFDRVMKRTSAHMFNMFIMKREYADSYLSFLFRVLDRLYQETDFSEYDAFQARMIGRVSELLLDVWLETSQIPYEEVPMISMEKVNWLKKGTSFLAALFAGKKYKKSF